MNWYTLYFITLFLANTFYYKEYFVVINNTKKASSMASPSSPKRKLYISKIGLLTTSGILCCTFGVSIFAVFLCFLLKNNATILMYFQILCLGYILYVGIKQMTIKFNEMTDNRLTSSTTRIDAFYDGFINSLSRYELLLLIMAIIAQYYENIGNVFDFLFIIFTFAILQFITSFIIIVICNSDKITNFIIKNANFISRTAGFILIILSSMSVRQILKF